MAEEQLKLEAQDALDELGEVKRLPYKLTAHRVRVVEDVLGYYEISFFDSRKQTIAIQWKPERESFKSAVRNAMELHMAEFEKPENGG